MGLRLHHKYGVAPMLTCCQICGGDTNELLLLGASANKVCEQTLGEPYQGSSAQRIPHGLCDTCQGHLKAGAAVYVCPEEGGTLLMFSAECVKRNEWPGAGRINRVEPAIMRQLKGLATPEPAKAAGT